MSHEPDTIIEHNRRGKPKSVQSKLWIENLFAVNSMITLELTPKLSKFTLLSSKISGLFCGHMHHFFI